MKMMLAMISTTIRVMLVGCMDKPKTNNEVKRSDMKKTA